jgi:hypothetical protein
LIESAAFQAETLKNKCRKKASTNELFHSRLVNAATGILVAIAIPVPVPEQNVFVSYNFEGNYNMPNVPADSFPGKIDRWTV